jgi:hypothetical protein
MRRGLATLAIVTWLAIAGVVATAVPAAAHPGVCASGERRNVGGTGPADSACTCLQSLLERRNVGGTVPVGSACTCLQTVLERRNVGGTVPVGSACACVQGLLERRNVGGTGPAGCPPWLVALWQRYRNG